MGDPQRLNDTEQLEILGLLEAVSTDPSAVRAARALAELMRHVNALGNALPLSCPTRIAAASRETWVVLRLSLRKQETQARTQARHHIPLAP